MSCRGLSRVPCHFRLMPLLDEAAIKILIQAHSWPSTCLQAPHNFHLCRWDCCLGVWSIWSVSAPKLLAFHLQSPWCEAQILNQHIAAEDLKLNCLGSRLVPAQQVGHLPIANWIPSLPTVTNFIEFLELDDNLMILIFHFNIRGDATASSMIFNVTFDVRWVLLDSQQWKLLPPFHWHPLAIVQGGKL